MGDKAVKYEQFLLFLCKGIFLVFGRLVGLGFVCFDLGFCSFGSGHHYFQTLI